MIRNSSVSEASYWDEGWLTNFCLFPFLLQLFMFTLNMIKITNSSMLSFMKIKMLATKMMAVTFIQDEELLEIFGWMVAINPVGQV